MKLFQDEVTGAIKEFQYPNSCLNSRTLFGFVSDKHLSLSKVRKDQRDSYGTPCILSLPMHAGDVSVESRHQGHTTKQLKGVERTSMHGVLSTVVKRPNMMKFRKMCMAAAREVHMIQEPCAPNATPRYQEARRPSILSLNKD